MSDMALSRTELVVRTIAQSGDSAGRDEGDR